MIEVEKSQVPIKYVISFLFCLNYFILNNNSMIFMYISDREIEVVKYGHNFLVRYQRFFSFYY